MTFKQKIHAHCLQLLNDKILGLEKILDELKESGESDTKSSAGDKHETARAMIQIEQENIGKQLNEVLEQKTLLEKITSAAVREGSVVKQGCLVKTNRGYLFLSIALGKIIFEDKPIMVVSPQSPLGMKLMGLNVKDSTAINGINYCIESIE